MRLPLGVRILLVSAVLVFAAIVLAPIAVMLVDSFRSDGGWSLDAYRNVLVEKRQWELLVNTLALGAMGTAGALLLGLPYAFVIARVEFPLRRLFSVLYVIPILTPPLVLAWGWTKAPDWFVLGGVRRKLGCALVFAVCYYPIVTLLASRALRTIDAGLEEAARIAGGRLRALLRVTLRLALPSILSGAMLVFIFVISDFAMPDFISTIGPKENVYAGEIFFRYKRLGSAAQATAASLPLVLLTLGALALILKLRGHRSYAAVSGDFRPPERIRPRLLGKIGALAVCAAVIGVSVVVPLGTILVKAGGVASFRKALSNPGAREDILASLMASSIAATAMVVLGFLLAYAVVILARGGRRRRSAALETAAILPLAIPALMIGVGLIRVWNRPQPIFDYVYTSQVIVILVYIARYLPFPVTAIRSAFGQMDPSLEEAAALAGASFGRRTVGLLVPVLKHSLTAAWVLAFIFSMRELDTMVLIPAGNGTLPFRVFNEIHFGRDPEIGAICLIMIFLIALPLMLYSLLSSRKFDPFSA